MDHKEITIYQIALKQAYDFGKYSEDDCKLLGHVYAQTCLFMQVARHDILFDTTAKKSLIFIAKWIMKNTLAPSGSVDLQFGLQRNIPYSANSILRVDEISVVTTEFKKFLAALISGVQADIMDLSIKAIDLVDAEKKDANYVIGMLEITAQNLSNVFGTISGYESVGYGELQKFCEDICRLIASTKAELKAQQLKPI